MKLFYGVIRIKWISGFWYWQTGYVCYWE